MSKEKMAIIAFNKELEKIRSQHTSLINADYLTKEIHLCERFIEKYPDIKASSAFVAPPETLANSARALLINGRDNFRKHQFLPLFFGFSAKQIQTGDLGTSEKAKQAVEQCLKFREYQESLGQIQKTKLLSSINTQRQFWK